MQFIRQYSVAIYRIECAVANGYIIGAPKRTEQNSFAFDIMELTTVNNNIICVINSNSISTFEIRKRAMPDYRIIPFASMYLKS